MTKSGLVSLALLVPVGFAVAACSDCGVRTVSVAQEKARASRDLVDAPGTLRMHAPAARFFRTKGDVRRFKATVGFDPAIYSLKRKWGPTHIAATKMGFKVYADGRLVADAGIMRPGDGTKTIEADVSGARMIALESVDGGYWLGTPQLLAQRCEELGLGWDIVPAVSFDGTEVSSTHIRTLLQEKRWEEAKRFLGHSLVTGIK